MEHVIQFGVTIDDQLIEERVFANAEKAIVADLQKQFKETIFDIGYYGRPEGISRWMSCKLDTFFTDHKDEIVRLAAENLTERMARTKAVREATAKVVAES